MAVTNYVTDGAIGIDLDTVGSASKYTLGETHEGSGRSEWIYVLAGEAITQGSLVAVGRDYVATPVNGDDVIDAAAAVSFAVGFAQTAFQSSQYGFVATRGQNVLIRVLGGVNSIGMPLFTTNTDGALSTATGSLSQLQVFGVYVAASVSAVAATASVVTANLSFPLLRKPQ